MIDTIGIIGSACLAICAVPEAYNSWKRGRSDISSGFLFLWGFGEICTLIYVLPKLDLPLILNYGINIIFIGIIFRYRYFPRI